MNSPLNKNILAFATRLILGSFLSLFVSLHTLAGPASQRPSHPNLLQQQAHKSFTEKFQVVTDDISKSSNQNLQTLLVQFKSYRDYDLHLEDAKKLAQAMDNRLGVFHGTSLETAAAILESGQFTSLDELVRTGKVDVSLKLKTRSEPHIDGVIGEQDVIFFSIEEDKTKKLNKFGGVVFELYKDKALNEGYFSLSVFGASLVGPRIRFPYNDKDPNTLFDAPFLIPDSSLSPAIHTYEKILFKGAFAYHSLLELSAIQTLWEKEQQDFKKALLQEQPALLAFMNKLSSNPMQEAEFAMLQPYLEFLNQNSSSEKRFPMFWMTGLLALDLVPMQKNTDKDIKRIVESRDLLNFTRFPWSPNGRPALLLAPLAFWELKIPKHASLDLVKTIRIPKRATKNISQQDLEKINTAILNYSKKSNRPLTIEIRDSYRVYRFQ